jgi:hypothetical protein
MRLVVAAIVLAGSPTLARAYCVGADKTLPNFDPAYYSVSHEFERSRYVIEGRVLREVWIGDDGNPRPLKPPFQAGHSRPWGFDPYMGAYYDVQVVSAFKWKPPLVVRIFSENLTARFWLDLGREYLVFVSEGSFDKPIGKSLTVDACSKSGALSNSAASLGQLQAVLSSTPK